MTDGPHLQLVRNTEPVTVHLTDAELDYLHSFAYTTNPFPGSVAAQILIKLSLVAAGQGGSRPGAACLAGSQHPSGGAHLTPDVGSVGSGPPDPTMATGREAHPFPPVGGVFGGAVGLTATRVLLTVMTVVILVASVWLLVAATTP